MTNSINELGQPIGESLADWSSARIPPYTTMDGRISRIEPINVNQHAQDLFEAYANDKQNKMWTYMTYGPFKSIDSIEHWLEQAKQHTDPQFFVLIDKGSDKAVGLASYMRIKPEHGVIEVGGISFSPRLQRTAIATEIMYLMMKRAFEELNYRRYEWKCDALNAASCQAAKRLGFSFDGIFKNHIVYKARNRDTAWYSILDDQWPLLKIAYKQWLAPENFDHKGQQQQKLADLIEKSRQD